MKIQSLDAKINSPMRTLTEIEAQRIDQDLAMLTQIPMSNVWVDQSGHIHQKVVVINLATFLQAIIDRIHKLISGINLKDRNQALFLIVKSQEILDKYIPFVLTATVAFPGHRGVEQLLSLQTKLEALQEKVLSEAGLLSDIDSFEERRSELQAAIDGLRPNSVEKCDEEEVVVQDIRNQLGLDFKREGISIEQYIEQLFCLEERFPREAKIRSAFDDLEVEVIEGKLLSNPLVKRLLGRGQIIEKLQARLAILSNKQVAQSKLASTKWIELLSNTLDLYALSQDKNISTFFDEICLKLFQEVSGAGMVITSVMTVAIMDGNELKLEKILSAMLMVSVKNSGNKTIDSFFKTVLSTFASVNRKIVDRVIKNQSR